MHELKEKVQVIMLPTEAAKGDNNILAKWDDESRLCFLSDFRPGQGFTPQHLYIISGRPIKEGYVYNTLSKEVQIFQSSVPVTSKYLQKVEASTDTSLLFPQPSPHFIAKYVELYNVGTPITEAEMEMSYKGQMYDESDTTNSYHPKLDKNNYITLRKVEEDWDDIYRMYNGDNSVRQFHNWLREHYNPPIKKK